MRPLVLAHETHANKEICPGQKRLSIRIEHRPDELRIGFGNLTGRVKRKQDNLKLLCLELVVSVNIRHIEGATQLPDCVDALRPVAVGERKDVGK